MSILEQTLPASFKGIPFLVTKANTTGGIKNVKHVFPNSSNQVIEKLGALQKTYLVKAFIHNDPAADDYKEKKDALISVLENQESGVLVHPLFGHVNNIVATAWNLDEDFSSLGIASFSITFNVDLPQSVPEVASNTLSQVRGFQGSVTKAITQDFAVDYVVDFFNNVSDSIEQVNDFITEFQDNVSLFTIVTDSVNGFNNQISNFGNNVANLVRQPLELAQSVENMFQTTAGMYESVDASFEVMKSFFDFGDNISNSQSIPDTAIRVERNSNRALFSGAVQAYALSHAYTIASTLEFDTIEDQEEVSQILETQYKRSVQSVSILDLKGDAVSVGLSDPVKSLITDQRISVQALFDDNRVGLGRILSVYTNPTSCRLLSYQYYGNSQLGDEIAVLNGVSDSSFIEGDIEIITS